MNSPIRNIILTLAAMAMLTAAACGPGGKNQEEELLAAQQEITETDSLDGPQPARISPGIQTAIEQEVTRQLEKALQERDEERKPEQDSAQQAVPEEPENPDLGICGRSAAARRTITGKLGIESCKDITPEDLYNIEELQITIQDLRPDDLAQMYNLRELQIDGLEKEIPSRAFEDLHNLRKLNIYTNEPDLAESRRTLLAPGTFTALENLEILGVTSDQGWATFELNQKTLSGLSQLQELRMDFITAIHPGAFNITPRLRRIDLHGITQEGEFLQRIPKEMFQHLGELEEVSLNNFRWPPLIQVSNQQTACAARNWKAISPHNPSGSTPLSVTIGTDSRPRDLESMLVCET